MTVVSELVDRLASVLRLDPEAWREDPYFDDIALEFAAGNESAFSGSGLDDNAIAELRQQAARISGHSPDHDEGPAHHRPSKSSGAAAGTDTGDAVARTDRHVARNIAVEASGSGAREPTESAGTSPKQSDTTSPSGEENAEDLGSSNGADHDERHFTDDGHEQVEVTLSGDGVSTPPVDISVKVTQSLEHDPTGKQLLEDGATLDELADAFAFSKQKYALIALTLKAKHVAGIIEPVVKERAGILREAARERERERKREDAEDDRQRKDDEKRTREQEKIERDREAAEQHAGGPQYEADADGMYRVRKDRDGNVNRQALTNFSATIIYTVRHVGGIDEKVSYELKWRLGARSGTCVVVANDFDEVAWLAVNLPSDAVIFPASFREAACAMRLLSGEVPERLVHEVLGWTEHRGLPVYRHGDGAIGHRGVVDDIDVKLRDELRRFVLPTPPKGAERIAAVRSLLTILDVAPLRVSLPLLAAIARAALGGAHVVIWFAGRTGILKSSFSALAQSCWGPSMWSDETLPFGLDWTSNALEACLHALKDGLAVVDDLAPDGGRREADQRIATTSKVIRNTANNRGRGRMRRDGTTYELKPRALVIFTGEDSPPGHSIAARMVRVEVEPGDIAKDRLTPAQELARSGVFSRGLAAYIEWLSSDLDRFRSDHQRRSLNARTEFQALGGHARTGALLGDLMGALEVWLVHAVRTGAMTVEESATRQKAWRSQMLLLLGDQVAHVAAEDPLRLFESALLGAIASKRAYLADLNGTPPPRADAWGWQRDEQTWRARGDRVGWCDGEFMLLETDATFRTVTRFLQESGRTFPFGSAARLGRALVQGGLVRRHGKSRGASRKMIGGELESVWSIAIDKFRGTLEDDAAQEASDSRSPFDEDLRVTTEPKPGDGSGSAAAAAVRAAPARPGRWTLPGEDREPGDDDPDEVGWRGGHR